MTRKEIIQALKDNLTKFQNLSKDEQLFLATAGKANSMFLAGNGEWQGTGKDETFYDNFRYRLRPDYKEEPEFIECELSKVLINEDYYVKRYRALDRQLRNMSELPDGYVIAGFKFEGTEQIITHDFGYSRNGVDIVPFASYSDLKSGAVPVVHATHVLFRKDTDG